MPAQQIGSPRGRFAMRNGVGRRMIDSLGWKSNPMRSANGARTFISPKFTGAFRLTGVTRNSVGATLGNCEVRLFRADTNNHFIQSTTSDGSGNFTFTIGTNDGPFWLEAYLPGSPDVAGTSLRTLEAVMA